MASPFDSLFELRREMDRLMNSWPALETSTAWSMPADVHETADAIHVSIEVPGLKSQDIELTIENGVLTVAGEKKVEREENREQNYRLYERRYGRFERSFRVPSNVRTDQVSANYEDGVLRITLPKTEEARPRRIEINGGGKGARKIQPGTGS
jgi:HSP20 family protein